MFSNNPIAIAKPSTARRPNLRFDSVVTLEHVEITLPDYPLEEYAHTYPFRYSDDELPNLTRGAWPTTTRSDDVARRVRQFLDPSGTIGVMSLLRSITLAIKDAFVYTRRSGRKGCKVHMKRFRGVVVAAEILPY